MFAHNNLQHLNEYRHGKPVSKMAVFTVHRQRDRSHLSCNQHSSAYAKRPSREARLEWNAHRVHYDYVESTVTRGPYSRASTVLETSI